ncbi:MAG: AAA family ATPase [Methanobrevibacter sp.]|jgi:exonuclease SbcC|nr:AAA family ATPase [Methanobrevibacter sp.]
MIFTKLQLKNFKSYNNTTIDFKPGISIIVGENGAGKSTILEAISFALFKQHSGKKIDDLIRITKMKNSHETMSVSLEFVSNGKKYEVTRTRASTSKSKLSIIENEGSVIIATGDKSVNEEIQSIINMDADLFINAIYIRQGEIANLVGKTPSEKKQLIGKLLGIEDLEKAWNKSLPLINIYENEKSELVGRVDSISNLDKELKTKKVVLDELRKKGNVFESELKDLEKSKEEKTKEKAEMEIAKSKFERSSTELKLENENIRKIIEDRKELQKNIDEILKMEEEIQTLEKDVKKLPIYLNFQESVKNIEGLKKEEAIYKERIDSIQKQKEILKKEKPLFEEYIQIQTKLKDLNERKSKLEGELEVSKQIKKDKEALNETITKNKAEIEEFFNITNKNLNIDIDNFDSLNIKIAEIKEELQEKLKESEKIHKEKSQEIPRLEEGIKSAEKPLLEIKEVDNQCPVCKSEISNDKKSDLINSYNNTINSNKRLISKIKEEIKKSEFEVSLFKNKLDEVQAIEIEVSGKGTLYKNILNDLEKIEALNNKLKYEEETKLKFADLVSLIDSKNKRLDETKENYNNYVRTEGSLESLGKEYDAKDSLKKIISKVDIEVEKIKKIMEHDTYLSPKIAEEDLNRSIEDLKEKETRYNQLKGSIKQKSNIESKLNDKTKNFNESREKIAKIEKEIKSSKYNEESYKNLIFIYERTSERIAELNKNISEITGKATEIIANIEDLNKKIKENKFLKEKLENINEFISLLKEIRSLYSKDGIQKDLRNRSKPLIQKYTKEFFEQFNFNYSDLFIDEEYNISVFGPEGESNLDMVSGGEKIAIALALRLGITQAMSKGNIETILLDEPTIHLDSYRRHELIDLLRRMSVLPQMIIVTHDVELETAADNIIKVKKENGISNVFIDE